MESCFDFVAGWVGGCAGLIIGHPFDTIKVRLQTKNYKSNIQCIINTYKKEKIRGFYNGMGFPLLTSGVANCIFFGVYGNVLRFLGHNKVGEQGYHPPLRDVFIAGCIASVPAAFILAPTDLIKVQLQSKKSELGVKGPVKLFKSIYAAYGLRGCFKGLVMEIIRDCPSSGLYFFVYEFGLKLSHTNESLPTPWQMMGAGGVAGVASWLSIIPLDVVKSRIQADDQRNPRYRGIIHCVVDSYRRDSISIFTRGSIAAALRAFPTNAVTLVTYSCMMDFYHREK